MSHSATARRALLIAALGFVQLPPQTPGLRALHRWLDTWNGVGRIAVGIGRQGYDVSLELRDGRTWHALITRDRDGLKAGAPVGYAAAPTPWQAMQWASWQVMKRGLR